jgi:prefoldin subunit 5
MAITTQIKLEEATEQWNRLQEQVYGLEEDIAKLKAVIEYLEVKLGINNPV